MDVDGRLDHKDRQVADQDRLRQVREGSDQHHRQAVARDGRIGGPNTEAPSAAPVCSDTCRHPHSRIISGVDDELETERSQVLVCEECGCESDEEARRLGGAPGAGGRRHGDRGVLLPCVLDRGVVRPIRS